MSPAASPARLVVTTVEIDPIEDLLAYADADAPLAWLRRGDGMVGFGGAVLTLRADGTSGRAALLADRWRAVADAAEVADEVRLPGTGLIGFGALAFDDRSALPSTVTVPAAIVGRRGGRSWLTRIRPAADAAVVDGLDPDAAPRVYGAYWSGTLGPGACSPADYQVAVAAGIAAIRSGALGKVVLARDLVGTVPAGADLRRLARALASGYPDCWTYAIDDIIGASPETLVTASAGTVTARVLAGTAARGADADADVAASAGLATSAKDQDEHRYAVESLIATLRPHVSALASSEQPFMLKLPNVWHLATDVEAVLADGASALDLVAALHPTAAVAGTPTPDAMDTIARLEPFDRGRYAGPAGWIDASGDGEWAIALRCAQFGAPTPDGRQVTAHAGAGIVAESDPESEMLETRVKFRPIVEALA